MKLSSLKATELIGELKNLVQKEKLLTLQIIDYLTEINRRKAFLPKHTSLFSFMTEELGYCAGTAQLRLNTLKALQVVPEVRTRVLNNEVSLNTLAKAQSFINNENRILKHQDAAPLSLGEQKELFAAVEQVPAGRVEEILQQKRHEIEIRKAEAEGLPIPQPRPRLQKMEFEADAELVTMIEELKSLLSHQCPEGNLAMILKKALPLAIQEIQIAKGLKKRSECGSSKKEGATESSPMKLERAEETELKKRVVTRAIPLRIKREVWKRDQGRCQFQDPVTKEFCHSRHQVEFEHVRPWSFGGEHSAQNVTSMCRIHNWHRWESLNGQT